MISFDGVEVPPMSIISVTYGLIHLATRPSSSVTILVFAAGGTSNLVGDLSEGAAEIERRVAR
jgi:hypothetical protein